MLKKDSFTLIELLIVITVTAILSAVSFSVLNARVQRQRAQDAVNRSNLQIFAEALENYRYLEGSYPTAPLDCTNVIVAKYLQNCAESGVTYSTPDGGATFSAYIAKTVPPVGFFKFDTTFRKIMACGATGVDTPGTCTAL